MEIHPLKTAVLKRDFDLIEALFAALRQNHEKLKNGDIIVFSSKIVALSQGRLINLKKIMPSERAKRLKPTRYGRGVEDPRIVELVLQEADAVIPGEMLLTMKDGMLIPEAGIDLSNAPQGFAILWPKNLAKTASNLAQKLRKKLGLRKLGIIIADSHCQPLRWGTTGLAIAWAGFEGVEDARGQKDIYGKKLKFTRKAVADNLTSAALVVMGEAGEKIPFVVIRNAPVKFTSRRQKLKEIFVKPDECLFRGIYNEQFRRQI